MTRKQTSYLGSFLLVVALTTFFIQQQGAQPEKQRSGYAGFDLFIEDIRMQITSETGEISYRLTANRITHFPDEGYFELTTPALNVLQSDTSWSLSSASGRVSSKGQNIFLAGAVDILQMDANNIQQIRILSSDVMIKLDEKTAETDNRATITGPGYRVSTTGFRADFENDLLELKSQVKGVFNVSG